MLSRVASSFYWLGRNVERAETIARILDVNYTRATDVYARRDNRAEGLWRSVMQSAGFVIDPKIAKGARAASDAFSFCAFDAGNSSSIVSAVRIARLNALGIRSELTIEVWEAINVLYLYVGRQNVRSVLREGPSKFLRHVRDWMQGLGGIADATLTHGDGWNFLQVGRFIERAYMTSRILRAVDVENEPWQESQRMLEMCCASAPFAQASTRSPEARDALSFVTLAADFPRSLRFCVREIDAALRRISSGAQTTDASRRLGKLRARFEFETVDELFVPSVAEFVDDLQTELERLSAEIEDAYFPARLPASTAV